MNITQSSILIASRFTEAITLGETTEDFDSLSPPVAAYTFKAGTSSGGTVAGEIDLHWESAEITLAAAATTTLTLSALVDVMGRTVALARVREFGIQITSKTNPEDYATVGGAATNPWIAYTSGTFVVHDCDAKVFSNPLGLPVAAGANDQLLITNSGAGQIKLFVWFKGAST